MQRKIICSYVAFILNMVSLAVYAQVKEDSNNRVRKNIIRYNLTGALFFGADKYIVLGYERIVSPRQSFSINMGNAALPKLTSLITDSFQTEKQIQRKGFNASVDYRFYLSDENKFDAPR